MQTIRPFFAVMCIFVLTATTNAISQNCQTPSTSQLFANSITLNSARINCEIIAGVSLYQFQYKVSGAPSWTIGTSSSQNFNYLSGLTSNTTYLFQCRIFCNGSWTSYSSSKSFYTGTGGNSCSNPDQLSCGSTYFGSSNTGNNYYTAYPFANSTNMTGPESVHRIVITTPAHVTFTMTPTSQDLDMFLLTACGNSSGLRSSQNSGTNTEQISLDLSPGTYYLIVDGWNGAVSNYSLSVQCTQSSLCATPSVNNLYTSNLTCSSVRLNSVGSSAYVWAWAYRPLNSASWTYLANTSTPYTDLIDLQGAVTYEFVSAVRCSNDVWSDWSAAVQFTTPSCNPGSNTCNNPILAYCGGTYSNNNNIGFNNYSSYSGSSVSFSQMYGPEVFYQITLSQSTSLSVSLTGLAPGKDLDLIMLSSCSSNSIVAYSGNGGNTSESFTVGNLPAGTYKIVVDGYNYAISNYTLSIQCLGTGCAAPLAGQLYANNLNGNSARINTTYQGASSFRWRYRQTGTSTWIELSGSSSNYANLSNLIPNTVYEFQCSAYCSGAWTAWSASQYFNTVSPYNNEPCAAYELVTGTGCYPVMGTNIAGSTSWSPTPPGDCNVLNMKDVWYKVLVPTSGRFKITTDPGSLKNGLLTFYSGSCGNLVRLNQLCYDITNGDEMPDVPITATPNTWVYIRFWGYDGAVGTFYICAQTLLNFQGGENDEPGTPTPGSELEVNLDRNKSGISDNKGLKLFPVPAQDQIALSLDISQESKMTIQVFNTTGALVVEQMRETTSAGAYETALDISSLPAGAYLMRVRSEGADHFGKFIKM